jgi:hypothetical protein
MVFYQLSAALDARLNDKRMGLAKIDKYSPFFFCPHF